MTQARVMQASEDVMQSEISMTYSQSTARQPLPDDRLLVDYKDSTVYLFTKRIMDFTLSSVALVALSPLMLAVVLFIYLDDPHGSPLFIQDRVGKNGKKFKFYKFRSMVVDAEAKLKELQEKNEMDGPVFKIRDDPRVTRVGKFIRRTSIDELPQLVNIIKGEMSIVGPRPPLPREVQAYGVYEMQRLLVKPGLTCYWQAKGRNEISFQEWMKLDMRYLREHSMWIDIKLIMLTIRMVLAGKGAM
jgi:lipopolysaccharide/colanic/teichoic acid biosynthesis glycosyltransferase